MKTLINSFFAAALSLLPLSAETLSINFNNGAPANRLTEVAGLVPSADWIEIPASAEGQRTLNANGTSLNWMVADFVSGKSPVKGVSTGHPDRLFRSQLRTSSHAPEAILITLTNLPPALVSEGYTVIVYWQDSPGSQNAEKIQHFTINGVKRTLITKPEAPNYSFYTTETAEKSLATSLAGAQSTNTAVVSNLKDSTLIIATGRAHIEGVHGSASNGGIAALQIVPSSHL